jgi:uncharacterized protein
MTTFLLDANVLIALIDPAHVQHDEAHNWFAKTGKKSWATCPMTENAVLRIVGDSRYPSSPGNPANVAATLELLLDLPGHVFWPDSLSIFDKARIDTSHLLSPRQITDSYLLALAVKNGGQLATFDRRMITSAVIGSGQSLHVIS